MFFSEQQKFTSSLPSVIPQVKNTLELKIPQEKIPNNNKWLNNRWDKIKKKGDFNLKYFLDRFKENYTGEERVSITKNRDAEEDDKDSHFVEGQENNEEEDAIKKDEFQTITVTLGNVLKHGIDYNKFLDLLTGFQSTTTSYIHGIQHIVSLITGLVLNGEYSKLIYEATGTENAGVELFDFTKLRIPNLKIREDLDKIALIEENVISNSIGLFSFGSLCQLLSWCRQENENYQNTVSITQIFYC
jgi:hypothetical protein